MLADLVPDFEREAYRLADCSLSADGEKIGGRNCLRCGREKIDSAETFDRNTMNGYAMCTMGELKN